jgi:hypothetical protein
MIDNVGPNKNEMIHSPESYFATQQKYLEARLSQVSLEEEVELEVIAKTTKRLIRDKMLGLFKVGELVSTILTWNKEINDDLREAKKEYLLATYFQKAEAQETTISSLTNFLTNPKGNTLFNRVLQILDDSPPNPELAKHLAQALHQMVNSDFSILFEQHKYALGQIEQLTPQALLILSDEENWPLIPLVGYQATGTKIKSDWLTEFTEAYVQSKGVKDDALVQRIGHSVNELISARLIEAHIVMEKTAKCYLTQIGKLLYSYLDINSLT